MDAEEALYTEHLYINEGLRLSCITGLQGGCQRRTLSIDASTKLSHQPTAIRHIHQRMGLILFRPTNIPLDHPRQRRCHFRRR